MGNAFANTGHNTTTTDQTNTSSTSPWTPQAQNLQNLFDWSDVNAAQRLQNGPYTGQLYSGLNTNQNNAINYATNYVNQTGNAANALSNASASGINSLGSYVNNAANYASGNFGATGGTNPYLTNASDMSALNALQQGYTAGTNANQIYNLAGTNNTAQNVANASQYINNDVLNGQIDAANADVARELNQSTLPTLNQQASAGGMLNSSRAGAATAQATQAAQEQMANTAATMRASAYNNALDLSQSAYQNNVANQLSANSQLGSLYGTGTSSLYNNQALAQNNSQFTTNAQLQGNSQLGTAAGLGSQYALDGSQLATSNYNLANAAGTEQQNDTNAQLQAAYQSWLNSNNYDTSVLDNWKNLLSGSYGSNSTSTVNGETTSPVTNQGWFGEALGYAGQLASIAGDIYGMGGSSGGSSGGGNSGWVEG